MSFFYCLIDISCMKQSIDEPKNVLWKSVPKLAVTSGCLMVIMIHNNYYLFKFFGKYWDCLCNQYHNLQGIGQYFSPQIAGLVLQAV